MPALVLAYLPLRPGNALPLKRLLSELLPSTRSYPGSLGAQAWRCRREQNAFYMLEIWASEAHRLAHHQWRLGRGDVARLLSLATDEASIQVCDSEAY